MMGSLLLRHSRSLRIKPSEVSGVKYVKYTDPSGFFTMNIPRGWKVKTGLKPDGKLDLSQLALEDVFLSLPSKLLCKEDCKGICPQCGKNLNEGPCGCKKEVDPRLAALLDFLDP